MPDTAIVKISNIGFVDVINTANTGTGRYSTATFKLQSNPPPGITQNGSSLVVTTDIRIKFSISASANYRLTGIAFWQLLTRKKRRRRAKKTVGTPDRHGRDEMPPLGYQMEDGSSDTTLVIYDRYSRHGVQGDFVWKCFLMIQDQNGRLGIIDPDIENQN